MQPSIRIAQQTQNSNDKATLLDMAQRWRELAEKVETDEREGTEKGNLAK
jgi:hypothetical protein